MSPSNIREEFGRQIGLGFFQREDICKFFQLSWGSTEALHLVLSSKSYFCKEFPKNNRVKAPVISEVMFILDRPHQYSEPFSTGWEHGLISAQVTAGITPKNQQHPLPL